MKELEVDKAVLETLDQEPVDEYPVVGVQGLDDEELSYVRLDPRYAQVLVARTAVLASMGI